MPKIYNSLIEMRSAVHDARSDAIADARRCCGRSGWLASRGTWLATADRGGQCAPAPEADCPTWDGSFRDIENLIREVELHHPNVTSIYIGGGYDWAESSRAYSDGDYDPWVSAWEVPVWVRDEHVAANLRAGRNEDGSSKGADEGEVATAGRY